MRKFLDGTGSGFPLLLGFANLTAWLVTDNQTWLIFGLFWMLVVEIRDQFRRFSKRPTATTITMHPSDYAEFLEGLKRRAAGSNNGAR